MLWSRKQHGASGVGCIFVNQLLTSFLLGWQWLIAHALVPDSDPELVEESMTHLRLRDAEETIISLVIMTVGFGIDSAEDGICCFCSGSGSDTDSEDLQ